MQKKYAILGMVISAVVVGSITFAVGKQAGSKPNIPSSFQRQGTAAPQNGRMPGVRGMFGGGVSGEVIAKDDKSITVKLADGGSKVVFLSASTQVSKQASASLADVTAGSSVSVMGTNNTDGSVTAQSVQLRPTTNPAN